MTVSPLRSQGSGLVQGVLRVYWSGRLMQILLQAGGEAEQAVGSKRYAKDCGKWLWSGRLADVGYQCKCGGTKRGEAAPRHGQYRAYAGDCTSSYKDENAPHLQYLEMAAKQCVGAATKAQQKAYRRREQPTSALEQAEKDFLERSAEVVEGGGEAGGSVPFRAEETGVGTGASPRGGVRIGAEMDLPAKQRKTSVEESGVELAASSSGVRIDEEMESPAKQEKPSGAVQSGETLPSRMSRRARLTLSLQVVENSHVIATDHADNKFDRSLARVLGSQRREGQLSARLRSQLRSNLRCARGAALMVRAVARGIQNCAPGLDPRCRGGPRLRNDRASCNWNEKIKSAALRLPPGISAGPARFLLPRMSLGGSLARCGDRYFSGMPEKELRGLLGRFRQVGLRPAPACKRQRAIMFAMGATSKRLSAKPACFTCPTVSGVPFGLQKAALEGSVGTSAHSPDVSWLARWPLGGNWSCEYGEDSLDYCYSHGHASLLCWGEQANSSQLTGAAPQEAPCPPSGQPWPAALCPVEARGGAAAPTSGSYDEYVWPYLSPVQDQGSCGNGFVQAAMGHLTDRYLSFMDADSREEWKSSATLLSVGEATQCYAERGGTDACEGGGDPAVTMRQAAGQQTAQVHQAFERVMTCSGGSYGMAPGVNDSVAGAGCSVGCRPFWGGSARPLVREGSACPPGTTDSLAELAGALVLNASDIMADSGATGFQHLIGGCGCLATLAGAGQCGRCCAYDADQSSVVAVDAANCSHNDMVIDLGIEVSTDFAKTRISSHGPWTSRGSCMRCGSAGATRRT
ncbi:unnamed protein product [Prorocentrum cordatum]|uniref:Uncharacterized protein n=1 Tax=Prorocentrum cordatum TaxID=2364126 RepID=A0ABN9XA90_9DINO|nr:unnamed protein product [Polarella glacialis]